jgi:hypothetical protein
MTRDHIIETLCRAHSPADWAWYDCGDLKAPGYKNFKKLQFERMANALTALESAGIKHLEREPTEAMKQKAWDMILSNLRYEEMFGHLWDAAPSIGEGK